MGHREDLLAGAKRCIYEKGFSRTTARDIVAASGTNLASIGYHFGSKEALLNLAMIEAIGEWSEELERTLATDIHPDATPIEQFEAIWTHIIESFSIKRQLWVASFEIFAQVEHSPEVRRTLADAIQEGRTGLATLFRFSGEGMNEDTIQSVGSFYHALMSGLIVQWLIDPHRAPTGHDMAVALWAILDSVQPPKVINGKSE